MRKTLLATVLALAGWGLAAGENLIVNPDFKLDDKGRLAGWSYPDRRMVAELPGDGTAVLKENAGHYTSAWSTTVPVEQFRNYKVSFEIKADQLGKMAGVYYFWLNDKNAHIGNECFLVTLKAGSSEWVKVEKILSQNDPANTRALKLCLAIYHVKDGSGKVAFRNVKVEAMPSDDDDEDESAAAPAAKVDSQKKK